MGKKKRCKSIPPLPKRDRRIYYILAAISGIIGLLGPAAVIGYYRYNLSKDARVIAVNNDAATGILFATGIILAAIFVLLIDFLIRKKQPIFGKKGFVYGPPRYKAVYPIFSKSFWKHLVSQRRIFSITSVIVILYLLIPIVVTGISIHNRTCIMDNGEIEVYNSLNQVTKTYKLSSVDELVISTHKYRVKSREKWNIEIKIVTNDGKSHYFEYGDVRSGVYGFNRIKAFCPTSSITIKGSENLNKVIDDLSLSQSEIDSLYMLFEVGSD